MNKHFVPAHERERKRLRWGVRWGVRVAARQSDKDRERVMLTCFTVCCSGVPC